MALQAGTQPSLMENTSSSRVASTKLGAEVARVVKNTMIRSITLPRFSAATEPSTTPNTTATAAAEMPSLALTCMPVVMVSNTSRPVFRLTPKSAWNSSRLM